MQSIIKPLKIGSLEFPLNLIQGPLAGFSCAPFRKLYAEFLAPAYCVTEMISAQDLVHRRRDKKSRYLWRDPSEKMLCYQLAGHCPQTLKAAALIAVDAGADIIDLNCGCPKPKIRKKKLGSYLLTNPPLIAEIVTAMKSVTSIPITVKIRVDSFEANHMTVAKAIEQAGADAIIVHGRHWQEDYKTACRLDQISEIVAAVKIPVIGNGDVRDYQSLTTMFNNTGCAAAMISRAGTGKPWLYQQLWQESCGKPYQVPSLTQITTLFFQHVEGLAQLENDRSALLQARKFLKYYFRDYLQPQDLLAFYAINSVKDLQIWLKRIG